MAPPWSQEKRLWFQIGCKHIYGVNRNGSALMGIRAFGPYHFSGAVLRPVPIQVFRKPVRPDSIAFFLATSGR